MGNSSRPFKVQCDPIEMPKSYGRVKVVIPSKEEVERMDMAGSHFHFNQRLNERYGIDVTLEEYMLLRRNNIQTVRREKHKIIGIMKIKGIDVLVVRERHRKKKLITALHLKTKTNGQNNAGKNKG